MKSMLIPLYIKDMKINYKSERYFDFLKYAICVCVCVCVGGWV